MRRQRAAIALLVAVLALVAVGASILLWRPRPPHVPQPPPGRGDALNRRVEQELLRFVHWLEQGDAEGYIGEVGWPDDDPRWNDLGRRWFEEAARAGLWVTVWGTGEWWDPTFRLAPYRVPTDGAAGRPMRQAEVIEAQRAPYRRGVNVNGGEFGAVYGNPPGRPHTSTFSNANPGRHGDTYHYDSQSTFDFLASRGVRLVRVPFRWERIQPSLDETLDRDELLRLRSVVERAGAAGIDVILSVQNYGAYYLSDGIEGVRRTLGSAQLDHRHFADLWLRLALAFRDESNVVGFGLMNEPVATVGGATGWETASQLAVDAIRSTGAAQVILVGGYHWSTVFHFPVQHPRGPWIEDPLGAVRYEAHHYFDHDGSGTYRRSYDAELEQAAASGW